MGKSFQNQNLISHSPDRYYWARKINRTGGNPVPFTINVFRGYPISGEIHLIRSNSLDDGKNINVLLIDFEDGEYEH